tara:strand:- start:9093 stop:11054 length:1962 start_codon:yes stop_codon:yes gene_type:complete
MAEIAKLGIQVDSKGVVKANENLSKLKKRGSAAEKSTKKLSKSFKLLSFSAKASAVALTGLLVSSVIRNTIEQERVTAQLNQTLKTTGRFSIQTSESLLALAANLQKVSTFGDEAIIASLALLATFENISVGALPRAQRAVLDMATVMGTDLKSAVIQVGKALDDPILGMSALSRSGITFTDAQKAMAKELVATGDLVGAQNIVFDKLEVQMKGSAKAARDTLGGSLKALGNAFGDLLEADGGSPNAATQSINELTDTLNDPSIKTGFQDFVTGILKVANAAATAIGFISRFGSTINSLFQSDKEKAALFESLSLADKIIATQKKIADTEKSLKIIGQGSSNLTSQVRLNEEVRLKESIALLIELQKLQKDITGTGTGTGTGTSPPTSNESAVKPSPITPFYIDEDIKIFTVLDEIKARYVELESQSDSLNQTLRTPLEIFNEEIALLKELSETTDKRTNEALLSDEGFTRGKIAAQERLDSALMKTTTIFDELKSATDGWARSFSEAIVEGTGTFKDFAESIIKQMQKIAIQQASQPLFDAFGGFVTESIGGLFSKGIGVKEELAHGTDFAKGGSTLVGELGPEIVNLPRGSQVIPNNKIGGSGANISVSVNVDAQGASTSGDQDGKVLGSMIGAAVRSVLIEESRPGGMLA